MAGDVIGVAILGAGGAARHWINAYRHTPGTRVVAVWDPDADAARAFAREHEDLEVLDSLEEVLAAPDIHATEVNFFGARAVTVATSCLAAEMPVGIRATAIASVADARALMRERRRKTPLRLFSHAFYYPPLDFARAAILAKRIGDLEMMRVVAVTGRATEDTRGLIGRDTPSSHADGAEYEALPLVFLLGEVRRVCAVGGGAATVVSWVSSDEPGGARFGVLELVRAPEIAIPSPVEPVDIQYEIAGTDGYVFGSGLMGKSREQPTFSIYAGETHETPVAGFDEDPLAAFDAAAADLVLAVRTRSLVRYGVEWVGELGLVRDAIARSLESGAEVTIDSGVLADEPLTPQE